MSVAHPIIAVTGSSGSGTSTVQSAFEHIFRREQIQATFVSGNSFRRFSAEEVPVVFKDAADTGKPISHFGPEANLFDRLEGLFREYARTGSGLFRHYMEDHEMAELHGLPVGTYSPWEEVEENSDLLFYEGQHGGCIQATWSRRMMSRSHNPVVIKARHKVDARQQDEGVDIAKWVDLLIGVVPIINLEWIQNIHQDCAKKGCSTEAAALTILRRMSDYVRYITPQFSLTDINFQRIPLVDTSNPFIASEVPSAHESMLAIRFREPKKIDFPDLLKRLPNSFMSRPNTIVLPGGEMLNAMDVICTPMVQELMEKKRQVQMV
jgi:phosphoribulokinase